MYFTVTLSGVTSNAIFMTPPLSLDLNGYSVLDGWIDNSGNGAGVLLRYELDRWSIYKIDASNFSLVDTIIRFTGLVRVAD